MEVWRWREVEILIKFVIFDFYKFSVGKNAIFIGKIQG